MLQVFLDVAYVCNGFKRFFKCFFEVFQKHVLSVLSVFRHMLQASYLDVSKVDRVLQMRCAWKTGGGTSGPCTQSSGAGDVRAAQAPYGCAKHRRGQRRVGGAWSSYASAGNRVEHERQTLARSRSRKQFKYVPDG
jgi:hypothetical protein